MFIPLDILFLCYIAFCYLSLLFFVHQLSPTFLAPGTRFMEDKFSMGREDCVTYILHLCHLSCPLLTSSYAAQFLTGHRPVCSGPMWLETLVVDVSLYTTIGLLRFGKLQVQIKKKYV